MRWCGAINSKPQIRDDTSGGPKDVRRTLRADHLVPANVMNAAQDRPIDRLMMTYRIALSKASGAAGEYPMGCDLPQWNDCGRVNQLSEA